MALFSFGKKKEAPKQAAPGLPIDQIMAMKQRGMSTNQIIPELERQGYNSSQIFDVLSQINISGNAQFDNPMDMPQDMPHQEPFYQQPYTQTQQQPYDYAQTQREQAQEETITKEQIEEIAEAIIDEKWKEFEHDVRIILEWKEKTEKKINEVGQQVKDLADSLNNLHKSLLSKISEYDRNILDVGTEIKAMEKVFEKVLPSLTENVNKLERMSKSTKLDKAEKK